MVGTGAEGWVLGVLGESLQAGAPEKVGDEAGKKDEERHQGERDGDLLDETAAL